jgi:hypothetical protein
MKHIIISALIGILVVLSFIGYTESLKEHAREAHAQQVELINEVAETCGTKPNKFFIQNGGFWVECGTELKEGYDGN